VNTIQLSIVDVAGGRGPLQQVAYSAIPRALTRNRLLSLFDGPFSGIA